MTNPSIELYGAQTGNCLRAAIALEEAMVPYTVRHVDLRSGEHRRAAYLALNPAGQVPTMVDRSDEASPFVLSQSNAIIFYAAARAPGRLLPEHEGQERAIAYERFFFFVTDVIAPSHAAFFLRRQNAVEAPGLLDERMLAALSAAERYVTRSSFMAGDSFSLADIVAFTIASFVKKRLPWDRLPNLDRWYRTVDARPAVVRGLRAFNNPPT
jgi:GST-like protein